MQNATQDPAALRKQLKELIVSQLSLVDVKPETIKDEAPLFGEGLGLDSLDAVELVVMLQRHFGVSIPDSDTGRKVFASVNSLAEFVQANRTK